MKGTAEAEQPANPEAERAERAFNRRIALYHYLPPGKFGDASDPAYRQYLEEAEQLRQANPLAVLAAPLVALHQQARDRNDVQKMNFFMRILNELKSGQFNLQNNTRQKVLEDVAAWGEIFPLHYDEPFNISTYTVDIVDYPYFDEVLKACIAESPSFTELRGKEDYWEEPGSSDVEGYSLSSPYIPTDIPGMTIKIHRDFSVGGTEIWSNIDFYLTPEAAQIAAKAPLIEIPELPAQRAAE